MPIAPFDRARAACTDLRIVLAHGPGWDAGFAFHCDTIAVAGRAVSRGLRLKFGNATCGTIAVRKESMRAEIQNLVEEIKQSVRLLRRHL